MSRSTLAQQLKQLESDDVRSIDPDSAYSNLDELNIPERVGNEGREHYLDVGPSRLRGQFGDMGDRYGGTVTGRQKIFDDDDEDEELENEGEQGSDEDEDAEDEEDEDDEGDDLDGEEEDEAEEKDNEGEEEEDDGEEEDLPAPAPRATSSNTRLDPIAALRDSRMKDVEKGKAIKRQKAIFDSIVTLRITFQKALTASLTLPAELPVDAAGEVASSKESTLRSLGDLSERLFALRDGLRLPGTEKVEVGTKRKRGDVVPGEEYWLDAARDSFALTDAAHPNMLPILEKWSSKIQTASLQVGGKGSKFLQSTKTGQDGITDAIQAGLATRKENANPLIESEETAYRSLLREVIESRSGQAPSDLSHLRREKKKKREAERGGSKGRKLRYTVQEKAQNFVVPIPLRKAWHDEQVDELFGSLFGGAGMTGAKSEGGAINNGVIDAEEGLAELGGLRVF